MQHTTPPRSLAIEARDIRRSLPLGDEQTHILNGVSFDVGRGAWIVLTGTSGSGKSTLLSIPVLIQVAPCAGTGCAATPVCVSVTGAIVPSSRKNNRSRQTTR